VFSTLMLYKLGLFSIPAQSAAQVILCASNLGFILGKYLLGLQVQPFVVTSAIIDLILRGQLFPGTFTSISPNSQVTIISKDCCIAFLLNSGPQHLHVQVTVTVDPGAYW
jgi:hypothetical protein